MVKGVASHRGAYTNTIEKASFTLTLPIKQMEELRRIAHERGSNTAVLVREAVTDWLEKQNDRDDI